MKRIYFFFCVCGGGGGCLKIWANVGISYIAVYAFSSMLFVTKLKMFTRVKIKHDESNAASSFEKRGC